MANNKLKRQKYSEGSFVYDSYNDQGNKYKDMIMNPQGFIQQQDLQQQVANANAKNSWYQDGLSVVGQGLISAGVAQATGALGAKIAGSKTLSATAKKGLSLLNNVGGSAAGGFLHNLPNLFPNMFEQGGIAGEEGNVEHVPIEAEGGEMISMPWDNHAMPIEGASHENGGVDMTVPVGSKIYSKRVKDARGVSMAKRKERRDRELKKWEKIVNDDPNNKIAKDTLEKVRRNNEIEEANDMAYMQLHKAKKQFSDYIKDVTKDYGKGGGLNIAAARQASDDVHSIEAQEEVNEDGIPKYKRGGVASKEPVPPTMPVLPKIRVFTKQEEEKMDQEIQDIIEEHLSREELSRSVKLPYAIKLDLQDKYPMIDKKLPAKVASILNKKNGDEKNDFIKKIYDALFNKNNNSPFNAGNVLQLAGIIHNMRKPMQAVLDNFRGKSQYRNFYRDYGKKSLLELDNMKDNIRQIRDENLRDLYDRQAAMNYSNNNSARDINVARAMNLATLAQITDAANKAYANYASMNNDVHKLRANALTDIDNKVMGEDKWADTMNREMRDSFFANKLEAQKAIGAGMQQMGKLFNKERYITELRKYHSELEKQLKDKYKINKG